MENFAKALKNLVHLEVTETFETVLETWELVIKIVEAGLCISFHYDVVLLYFQLLIDIILLVRDA
jgi:hypothetical protein